MTGQTISHYRILAKLGEGAMGVVYRAEDTKLRREVALKFLPDANGDAALRDRFLREAQAAAALNHPNICTIFEIDEERGFIAMELVEGPSLKDKIGERPLKLDEALDFASQIAAGLQAAHEKGVTHRDIKPANILLTQQGQVKITDFGLAALADRTRITKTGTSMGTPAYMSPEQAKGEPLDRRTDLWSLGVVLYEMLTGRLPFAGDTEQAVSYGIVHTDPEPPTALRSGLPLEIDRVTAKALAKNPGERYQNAADLQVDLKRSATSTPRRGAVPGSQRKWAPWVAATAGLVAAVLAMVHFTEQPAMPDPIAIKLTGAMSGAALSPDGLNIVYSDLGPAGSRMLMVRELASAEPRPLDGTEGATQPFWSPDGREIGFFAKEKLRRIPAAGGPIETICDIESGRGASWNQAGDIILQPESRLPLHIVKATGGASRPITKLDASRQENSHRNPQFLPDGKHFLFLARATPENTAIYAASLDGGQPKRILDSQSNAIYAAGFLYHVRDGTLYRQKFDPSSLTLSGERQAVAKEVSHSYAGSVAQFHISGNGRTLRSSGISRGCLRTDGAVFDKLARMNRRTFLAASSSAALAVPQSQPKKIAAIITEYRPNSHADVIIGKYLEGFNQDDQPPYPRSKIVSMFTEQVPKTDMSRERAKKYGVPIYRTVSEALTLGGDRLAVDGVILIGEHGDYPSNDKEQKLYPRFEMFLKITDVFRQSGRSVPVFNDKHLSWSWRQAKRMVEISRELKFPMLAGSSVPVAFRQPAIDTPFGAVQKHAVAISFSGLDIYGFHVLEALQCVVERRKGGETGVKSVQCLENDACWNFIEQNGWVRRLFDQAISHSGTREPGDPKALAKTPAVFVVDYSDGLKGAAFLLTGLVRDFTVAVDVEGQTNPISTLMNLQPGRPHHHFGCLVKNIEIMFGTGRAPYPVERTMLTSGILDFALESRIRGHQKLDTPELTQVRYQTPNASHFCAKGWGQNGKRLDM